MTAVIAILRGVNLGNRRIKMEALRALCGSLELENAQTYIQSGNVVFATREKLERVAKRLGDAIESEFGFRSDVILRTAAEMRDVVKRNPFAKREDVVPGKLLVWFLPVAISAVAREKVLAIEADPEELVHDGRELFIYFPNGQARPKLSMAAVEKALGVAGTGRNWNTVLKLLEIAERLE